MKSKKWMSIIGLFVIFGLIHTSRNVQAESASDSNIFSAEEDTTKENDSGSVSDYTVENSSTSTTEKASETETTVSNNYYENDSSVRSDLGSGKSFRSYVSSEIPVINAGETNRPATNFIDVSSHNGNITQAQYEMMMDYGITGVVIKLTEGTSYLNPYAESQIANAQAAGMKVSVYHYSHYTSTVAAQQEANYFASRASELGLSTNTVMVIDIEETDMQTTDVNTYTKSFKTTLNNLGYSSIAYYMSASWLDTSDGGVFQTNTFGKSNIWVAQYPYTPTASMLWNNDFGAWQWSSQFYFPDISHAFDVSADYTGLFSYVSNESVTNGDTLVTRRGNTYYFKYTLGNGEADQVLTYGKATDDVYVGDWDGDGVDTLAVRRGNVYYIKNSMNGGEADQVVVYGKATDTVLVGDWDGDGVDTLAVKRGNLYYIKNEIDGGEADKILVYGKASDSVFAGDWDGDGVDTLTVRRGNSYYIKNSMNGGEADQVVVYGKATDMVLVGDWDGDAVDTLAVRRNNIYYIKNTISGGTADKLVVYGKATDEVYAGKWSSSISN